MPETLELLEALETKATPAMKVALEFKVIQAQALETRGLLVTRVAKAILV